MNLGDQTSQGGAVDHNPSRCSGRWLIICGLLILATVAAYWQVRGYGFVDYDDPEYVVDNAMVVRGFSADGLVWAFTTGHAGNWHPLTWLSHMLDCQLFGLEGRWHHITSLLLHLCNAIVLFGLLRSMTGADLPSAFVAALFAVHPLSVESVAWVAQRKNLLSTLVCLLAIWSYANYACRGGLRRYLLTALWMGLSLAAKPMMVTLPALLLLLDYWPLNRLWPDGAAQRPRTVCPPSTLAVLLMEKAGLLILSAVSAVVTMQVQQQAGAMAVIPFGQRLANAAVSYVSYLCKMIWPADLSVLYPHPNLPGGTPWTPWQVGGSVLLLVILTAAACLLRRYRFLIVGWLWYLGALLPVLGLVQVGEQAMADRYVYVPMIGLFLIIAWVFRGWVGGLSRYRQLVSLLVLLAASSIVLLCILTTRLQVRHWRDSLTLFSHAVAATPSNPIMHNNLGVVVARAGRPAEAVGYFEKALRLDPRYPDARINLATAIQAMGKVDEAIDQFHRVLQDHDESASAHLGLANALAQSGKYALAIEHYQKALAVRPDLAPAHYRLAIVLGRAGRSPGALEHARRAAELTAHRDPSVLETLAGAFAAEGQFEKAAQALELAIGLVEEPRIDQLRARQREYRQQGEGAGRRDQ